MAEVGNCCDECEGVGVESDAAAGSGREELDVAVEFMAAKERVGTGLMPVKERIDGGGGREGSLGINLGCSKVEVRSLLWLPGTATAAVTGVEPF